MRLLLDTHVVLWYLTDDPMLSLTARGLLTDPENDLSVSVISLWEISLKYALGKLSLAGGGPELVLQGARSAGMDIVELGPDEAAQFHQLPRGRRDPFDRMLVWQAIRRGMGLVSADKGLDGYAAAGLRRLW